MMTIAKVLLACATLANWSVTTPYYTMRAPQAVEEDGKALAATLDAAIAKFNEDFAAANSSAVLKAAQVEIHIAAAPNELCGIGQATATSSFSNGKLRVDIHLLAPSAHPDPTKPGAPRTLMDEPQDMVYCQRVLVHEYSTVLLEGITRAKGGGWGFQSAPSWFVQGAEEYLGLMYSTPHARNETFKRYVRATREQKLVSNDFGLEVQQPYVAGPVVVAFMVQQFGRDKFVALLQSKEPSFGKAMRTVLQRTPDQFYEEFSKWLKEQS